VPHRYIVEQAVTGADAFAKAFADPPDIILAETRLPVFDGYALCRMLQTDRKTRDIPIALVTEDPRRARSSRRGLPAQPPSWSSRACPRRCSNSCVSPGTSRNNHQSRRRNAADRTRADRRWVRLRASISDSLQRHRCATRRHCAVPTAIFRSCSSVATSAASMSGRRSSGTTIAAGPAAACSSTGIALDRCEG
jgi:response regulator RpfG family c-di-GMP phosphodiesterase